MHGRCLVYKPYILLPSRTPPLVSPVRAFASDVAECCCPLFVCYLLVGGCSLLGGCNLKNLSSELSSLALAAAAAASATRFTLAAAAAARPPCGFPNAAA